MKFNTIRKYKYSAAYAGYKEFQDPDTGAVRRTYEEPIEIKCWIVNNALGELVLHTKARLQNDGGIGTLLDKNSELVYPIGTLTGAVWRVIEGMPMYDPFGNVYEYKYRCLMIIPKQGSVSDNPPSEFINGEFWNF
jgi:hypothetical protein